MQVLKGNVITDGILMHDVYVGITEDRITYVGSDFPEEAKTVQAVDGYISPGWIDQHIHGINGYDFMDGDRAFSRIAVELPQFGVTSFLATSRTSPLELLIQFLQSVHESKQSFHNQKEILGAEILGAHIEGPWISHTYRGAQPAHHIQPLSKSSIDAMRPFFNEINMITLAPEEIKDLTILEHFKKQNITISAGHTNATMEDILSAMRYGLSQMTHTFNAMSPMHHRHPGAAAAALYDAKLHCEVIADGLHVHPKMVALLYKIKGFKKISLISDCTGYNHLTDGIYKVRGKKIHKKGHQVSLPNGSLAGSAMTLDQIVKYAVEHCQIPIEHAVYMVTTSPAQMIHTSSKVGRLAEGYQADITILNKDLTVQETIKKGRTVYRR